MQPKKDHTKRPLPKYVQVKETRPIFFLFKINLCAHKQARGTPPKNFHVEPPCPFSPFIFLFLLGASWRAGGRAGVSFSRVHGTGAGHHPGAGTKARFSHGCNRAHVTGGGETRTVEALPGDGGRPPGRTPARARGERGRKGRRTVVHACAGAGAFAATGKSATVAVVIGLPLVLFGLVWFVSFCCWYCFSILVTTGGWLG